MSQLYSLPHPDDASLITICSKQSSRFSGCDFQTRLSAKVEKLTQRNVKLQEKLSIKDQEISELQEKNKSLDRALSSLTIECTAVSTQKVAELSKNNRHLSSQLMSVKSKFRDLEDKYQKLEEQLENKEKLLSQYNGSKTSEPSNPSQIQQLTESLEKTKKKLFEATNSNHQLKNELKIAHKCLQQEIGNDVINISQILSSNSNWYGRAQQIQMLQSKVSELKEKLDATESESFDLNQLPVKRLDSMRKLEIESLKKELDECKNELDDLKNRASALKIRNKNISDEANSYKIKTLELLEKSKNDDGYINCLNEKISMIKFEHEHKIKEMEKEMMKIRQLSDDSKLEVWKIQCGIDNVVETLSAKENEIEKLKMLNEDLENNLRNISGDFLFSCRNMNKTEFVELVKALEKEKNQLLNMIDELNKRLNSQSAVESDYHDIMAKQKIKIARLEAKIRELENEKEAIKVKNRRGIRINEYSRSQTGLNNSNCPMTKSSEKFLSEIDRLKFKLEYSTERIAYLEKKLQMENNDKEDDRQRFIDIIGKSKEYFTEIFQESNISETCSAVSIVKTSDAEMKNNKAQ